MPKAYPFPRPSLSHDSLSPGPNCHTTPSPSQLPLSPHPLTIHDSLTPLPSSSPPSLSTTPSPCPSQEVPRRLSLISFTMVQLRAATHCARISSIDSLLGVMSTAQESERGGTWEMEKGRVLLEGSIVTTTLGHTRVRKWVGYSEMRQECIWGVLYLEHPLHTQTALNSNMHLTK